MCIYYPPPIPKFCFLFVWEDAVAEGGKGEREKGGMELIASFSKCIPLCLQHALILFSFDFACE